MKHIATLALAMLGVLADLVTLIVFVFSNNWQAPTISGLGRWDWAFWTAFVSIYVLSVLSAVIIHGKNRVDTGRAKETRPEGTILVQKSKYKPDYLAQMCLWTHVPFAIPLVFVWIRVFVDIPPDPGGPVGQVLLWTALLGMIYPFVVMIPVALLTYLILKTAYDDFDAEDHTA